MVKVRGYRVELGEVERVLCGNVSVNEAVAIVISEGETPARIAACVSPATGAQLEKDELRAYCAGVLPPYMVPDEIWIVPELPRTATGKADRKAIADGCVNSVLAGSR